MKYLENSQAYLQTPSFNTSSDALIFSTDDDLWRVGLNGGTAFRITNSKGVATHPQISPDGKMVAYLGTDSGQRDIYIMDARGGVPKRLTFDGVINLCGWENGRTLIFTSNQYAFNARVSFLYSINIESLEIKEIKLGPASTLKSLHSNKTKRVLGRNNGDPARWKRYRGGTAGTLWLEQSKGQFKQILKSLKSNLTNPEWVEHKSIGVNPRIFFISDHEGIGNIYSCNKTGTQVKRHTHSDQYYIRNFSYNDGLIIYQAGADLYKHDLRDDSTSKLEIHIPSSFNQAASRVEDAEDYLQEYTLHTDGSKIGIITRGQLFVRSPWSSAPIHLGDPQKRYRHPTFIKTKDIHGVLAVELNEENEETLKLFSYDDKRNQFQFEGKTILPKQAWGKINTISVHPEQAMVAISNNRNELFLVKLGPIKLEKISTNSFHYYSDMSWSPCGNFLAYSEALNRTTHEIKLYDLKTKKSRTLIPSVLSDTAPCFDPNGEYLYFIGMREFHPNYTETHFELSFPFASKVYAVALQNDLPSPLELYENFDLEEDNDIADESEDKKATKKVAKKAIKKAAKKVSKNVPKAKKIEQKQDKQITQIDWDGIENRIFTLPIPLGGYRDIACIEDKIFILKEAVKGLNPFRSTATSPTLYTYCLKEKKLESYQKECHGFELSLNGKYIIMDTEDSLRLNLADSRPTDGEEVNKKDGHLDLSNIRLLVEPKKEWKQMYQEAWILQREHFWSADMNKIDWQQVYLNYLPLLDKVHTRKEFSDLMWEMQGELGTSHCYEFGGDYHRRPKNSTNGNLGAELKWSASTKTFTILDIPKGDSWIAEACSPLRHADANLNVGDQILGIDGRSFTDPDDLNQALIGRNGQRVQLEVKRKSEKESDFVEVIARNSHHLARYRDWVNKNKEYVHKKSKGKIGYVHIPDMGVHGFSEFYRNFLSECTKEGLIVDVRYNGGGHISQHILKILAQRVVGFDKTRYMDIEPYPAYAINGPIVALTNEHAGSDGDIFSHSFKLMNIGPLLGKRTWGGVVGIWPRHPLNDGTITSQPEFSFWFKDVGYQVENYGTDPDIEVENSPMDWARGIDRQLDRSIEEVIKRSKKNPPLRPNLNKNLPNLKAPKLPKK